MDKTNRLFWFTLAVLAILGACMGHETLYGQTLASFCSKSATCQDYTGACPAGAGVCMKSTTGGTYTGCLPGGGPCAVTDFASGTCRAKCSISGGNCDFDIWVCAL